MNYLNKYLYKNQATIKNRFTEYMQLKKEYRGNLSLLDFGIGESNHRIPSKSISILQESVANQSLYHYTDNDDYGFLEAAKHYLKETHNLDVKSENLAPSLGTKSALVLLSELFVSEGDMVIVTTPGYNVFENAVKRRGGEVYSYVLNESNDYRFKIDDIEKEILKRAKIILINYPNNPSSRALDSFEYQKIGQICKKYDIVLINDAAYLDVTNAKIPSLFECISFDNYAIELFTLSKSHNMTGVRLGFILGNASLIQAYRSLKEQVDSGTFLPLLLAGKEALEDLAFLRDNQSYYAYRRKMLTSLLKQLGFIYLDSEATFYIYVKIPKNFNGKSIKNATEFATLLLDKFGIFVIPYDSDHHVRLSLTYREKTGDIIKEVQYRLRNVTIEY